jgi:hypothetical protein
MYRSPAAAVQENTRLRRRRRRLRRGVDIASLCFASPDIFGGTAAAAVPAVVQTFGNPGISGAQVSA